MLMIFLINQKYIVLSTERWGFAVAMLAIHLRYAAVALAVRVEPALAAVTTLAVAMNTFYTIPLLQ